MDDDDIEPSWCSRYVAPQVGHTYRKCGIEKRTFSKTIDLASDTDEDEAGGIDLQAAGNRYRKISRIEIQEKGADMCKKEDLECTLDMDMPDTLDLLRFGSTLTCRNFTPYGIIEDCAPFVRETQSIRPVGAVRDSIDDLDSNGDFDADDNPTASISRNGTNRGLEAQSDIERGIPEKNIAL